MKRIFLISGLCICAFVLAACTASQLASADKLVGGTPLQPTTVVTPATNPTSQPTVTTVQPTTQQVFFHFVQDASSAAQPVVTNTVPAPFSGIINAGLLILGGLAGVFAVKQTSALGAANNAIAAAAPGALQLAGALTSNPSLAADLAKVAPLVSGITTLLIHPAAASAAAAAGAVPAKQ